MILANPPFGKKGGYTIVGDDGKISTEKQEYERDEFWATTANKQLNNDGTAGKGDNRARDTASVVAMKLRLGLPVVNKDKIFQMIRNGQEADGGWKKEGAKTSDLETTYRVMRAMVLAKERPKNTFKLGEFLASCRNADGGYGTAPGEPSSASGTYYCAVVSKWLETKK